MIDEFMTCNKSSIVDGQFCNENSKLTFEARDLFNQFMSWSVPSQSVIDAIKTFVGSACVVDYACGLGLWTYLMRANGINAKCYDPIMSPSRHYFVDVKYGIGHAPNIRLPAVIDAEIQMHHKRDIDQTMQQGNACLFMSWPPYDSSVAFDTLSNFRGNKLIYIGESEGGCTADDNFFEELQSHWTVVRHSGRIRHWDGMYDQLYFYVRN
jgi:hypothetical protein